MPDAPPATHTPVTHSTALHSLCQPLSHDAFLDHARQLLTRLYPERYEEVLRRMETLLDFHRPRLAPRIPAGEVLWSERDQWLITYGDSLQQPDEAPLATLNDFLASHLGECLSGAHVLPFFPWSSDDGFSVVHYREVNPALGDWQDIRRLSEQRDLMADLVINHCSRESLWFADYLAGVQPGRDYFIEMDPETDISAVVRPRPSALLTPVHTRRGLRHLWATFSDDQIDLNFGNPDVLLEFIGILLYYLEQGARMIRLDAVAFLWKRLGTSCIHLEETHAVVRLLRAIVDHLAPGSLLITETNVPHTENMSYFGLDRLVEAEQEGGKSVAQADEAHLIYQFTLPPLTLHTLTSGDASALTAWANSLPTLPAGCSYFNFTASHDGIGVRALEGLLPDHERDTLVRLVHDFGGYVSMRANPGHPDTPYELNISYFDALKGTRRGRDPWQIERFIASQTLMLSLQGIPGLYIHSLTATPNHQEGVERDGHLRAINRRKWHRDELEALLASPNTATHEVFHALKRRMELRREEPCFHPDAQQHVFDMGPDFFVFERVNHEGRRLLFALNVTDQPRVLPVPEHWQNIPLTDHLCHDKAFDPDMARRPYQAAWLMEQTVRAPAIEVV
ncbi:sugar phosphorylase [Cobetia crustatorum]|uniref:sugar phosphorylase n=1 Tax=Cobetia crustatorum TaxID=553385 RepID=UPI00046A4F27|nr:sugar phosphorylase [Cobetia crustatorum]